MLYTLSRICYLRRFKTEPVGIISVSTATELRAGRSGFDSR